MDAPKVTLSSDQAEAYDTITQVLSDVGVDLENDRLVAHTREGNETYAILGKAGSGKTLLLAELVRALDALGVDVVSGDYESRRSKTQRSLAILAPTNKAASVLRTRGVPATTLHRILYTPVYDPAYEKVAAWLVGETPKEPDIEQLTPEALARAARVYKETRSIPGALAAAGLKGSDFITGWKRREAPLDIGFVDESSMLDEKQFDDLREIFPTLVLFGDPAQLAPVNQSGQMVFETLPDHRRLHLSRVHRQTADNPILDLAHTLSDPELTFDDFQDMITHTARQDDRIEDAARVDADLMARSPVLVWRNATRVRLITAFRAVHGADGGTLLPGEPLVCDGIELPLKHRKRRIDLEARGLIKGAQVIYLGPGRKPGFSKLHIVGASEPQVSAASIVKIEIPDQEEPLLPFAAHMGVTFLHGAAVTIHKAQGSQWETVQVFGPDISAASYSGRTEAGHALWKRLAYVAITRASQRLIWVRRYALAKPKVALGTEDITQAASVLELQSQKNEAG